MIRDCITVKSAKCPNEKTSRLGSHFMCLPCASGGMYSIVPGKLVQVLEWPPGQGPLIYYFKNHIFSHSVLSQATHL